MCIDCSGIHRMLGTHITKIKSTTLDKWEHPWVDVLARMGNVRFNAIYEANLLDRNKKPRPGSSMDDRERYIRLKYERQAFRAPPTRESLTRAAAEMDISIDALGPGYMEGIDTGSATGSDTPSTPGVDKSTNPAVLRRQQKKAAEEAEAKAKVDAEANTARLAAEAAQRQAAEGQARLEEARRLEESQRSKALADSLTGGAYLV